MKKFIWIFLLLIAIGAIGYFVGYPLFLTYQEGKSANLSANVPLTGSAEETVDLSIEGWIQEEKIVYTPRDIPSIEADFYALGYPPFLYVSDSYGEIDKSSESSHHESGMVVVLSMNDKFFVVSGSLEYAVGSSNFSSTAMGNNIRPICDFIKVITNREVSSEDQNELLREYTAVFNESDNNIHTVLINGLSFTLSIDRFYQSIMISF